ncbi:TonB-dependent receptor [Prosthecochloris sp. SCSIO W1101]|uniref:TonB-dependent receptor n=1 Tax=Prosthecochloris sp. SCSIO W1101 TaxID=2992242 RepID=UPI00223D5B12|nr:TonB-dependent receptor [Prosthecochloris sp. SCSIO W1101]UZJ40693.1 TonB-dependent receptor [Prosthecochloris sp. SCSIO W1101]
MKEVLHKGLSATIILVFGILFASNAFGETNEDGTVDMVELETITVTAQKREEDVQKVTKSITVLSDTFVEDAQIESTEDIWVYVPNLSTANAGSRDYFSRIRVRGISNTPFGDPAVALFIDDVPYAGVYAFNSALFDIERIEVLKGPQGTLYGKNTSGGAINIVTKSPGDTFEAKAGIEAGNFDKRKINGVVNIPLFEDKLFFRVAGLYSVRDGYIKNLFTGGDVDNRETIAGSASLFFAPMDNLSFDLTFRIHDFNDDGGFPMVARDKSKYQAVTGLAIDDFETATNFIGESSSKNQTTSLRMSYELDNFDLVAVTAYRNMDNESSLDADFTPRELYLGFNSVESESISQELRIQSKDSDESFKWLAGLYYSEDEKDYETGYKLDRLYADMMGVPIYTVDMHSAGIGAEDMAVFGQGSLRFLDDAMGLTAGLRYERSERSLDHQHTFGGLPVVAPINGLEETYSEFLPKLALDYRIDEDIMTYVSVARGYKAGGFAYAVDDPELVGFDPEISTAFELGLKTEFPELGLRLNIAGFYTKVDDYQDRVQFDPMTVIQENVSEADIYGLELEASMPLSETLSLTGFLGYTHAEYGDYLDRLTLDNYENNRISQIPAYDSGLFLEYRDSFGLFARAEVQLFGSSYFDRANTIKQDSYALFNMKVGYEQDSWDVYLSGKNLADKQYFLDGVVDPMLGFVGTVGEPRTVNLSFNYRL